MKGERINVPEGANCYRYKSGKIKFYESNPEKRFKKIPDSARGVAFQDFEKFCYWTYYGKAEFYDSEGNNLKMEDC